MMKKILGLLIAFMMATQAFASIAVAPMRLEIDANKFRGNYITTSINVTGDKRKPMRFKVSPGYFKLNENNDLMVLPSDSNDPYDISKKVKFVPSEFTVLPGKSQRVRLNILNLNKFADGESRAILFIEDVEPKEIAVDTGRAGYGAQLIIKTRLGVPIYIDKGKVSKIGEIEEFKVVQAKDGLYTQIKISSKGNSRIRYEGKIQIIQGKKLIDEYAIDDHVVGLGTSYTTTDKIKVDKIKQGGEYTLRAIIHYMDGNGKRQNLKQEIPLNIKGNT